MHTETHSFMDGKVHVYRRPNSRYWQCSTYMNGRKRGVGYCKSMTGAILPFQRMQKRDNAKPTDKIFDGTPRRALNEILDELNLKYDRDKNVRTAYSCHTYICLRLMEGADIYQIAKNCRTSVEMIEQFYAAHLKNTLDASAINVRKEKKKPVKTS